MIRHHTDEGEGKITLRAEEGVVGVVSSKVNIWWPQNGKIRGGNYVKGKYSSIKRRKIQKKRCEKAYKTTLYTGGDSHL